MRRIFGALVASAAIAGALVGVTGATTTNLPGGTSLSVSITSPTNGAVLPLGDVTVQGNAAVGTAAPIANTLLIYVIDVSGSTSAITASASACPNQNHYDTTSGTTLDCELLAIKSVNEASVTTGTVAQVGLIAFGGTPAPGNLADAAALDLGPGVAGSQTLIAPAQHNFAPSATPDLETVLTSAYVGPGVIGATGFYPARGLRDGFTLFTPVDLPQATNFWAAVKAVRDLASHSTAANKIVAFMSDGESTTGGPPAFGFPSGVHVEDALAGISGIKIDTFALGSGSSCNGGLFGTLQTIANSTGGVCRAIGNPGDAAGIVPAVIASQLASVTLQADGGATTTEATSPATPHAGPVTTSFSHTYSGLAVGPHHICATASGSDGGGTGTAQDCVDVTLQAPPAIDPSGTFNGNGASGDEGSAIPLSASVTSTGTVALTWTVAADPGTDPGAACSFDDAHSASPQVTCNDNGPFTLTLTADDSVNPPVSQTAALAVANVAPSVVINSPAPGYYPQSLPVAFDASVTDPGSNDTQTCAINWGDGTTDAGIPVLAGHCNGSHLYATGGPESITVTALDDNGGLASTGRDIFVVAPPTVDPTGTFGPGGTTGDEGSAIPLSASVVSTGPTALHWTVVPGPGTDAGTSCAVADPTAASTTVTCTDNGPMTVLLELDDHVNPAVRFTAALNVSNVPPTPVIVSPAGGGIFVFHSAVGFDAAVTDPGTNDTVSCAIAWGDGTIDTVPVTGSHCVGSHVYAGAGPQTVNVTATDDNGGTGAASVHFRIQAPPSVNPTGTFAGNGASGNEGSAIPLSVSIVSDVSPTLAWSVTGNPGNDAGAACTIANPAAAATSVTCNDNGSFTLSLTLDDHLNPPITLTAPLAVANVAPTVHITSPASGGIFQIGTPLSVHATISDPGSNDTQTCSISWGDGAITPGTVSGNACDGTHTYVTGGSPTISVSATDDNGGTGSDSVTIRQNRPPDCSAATASPNALWPPDHKFVLVTVGGCTDADGDHVTIRVTGVTQDEPLNGLGDGDTSPDAKPAVSLAQVWLRSERAGGGDGRVYTIAFTATDGRGGTTTGTVKVGVPHNQKDTAIETPGVSVNSFG